MKLLLAATLASTALAHYVFPSIIEKGVATPAWEDVRQYTTYYTFNGVTDVDSVDIRCNVNGSTIPSNTTTINAGDTIGFTVNPSISHPGPALVSGAVWFKIWSEGPSSFDSNGPVWPTTGLTQITFPTPKSLPTGDYLVRMEHIAVHVASTVGGAQFYISCAQVHVQNGGSGKPTPTVSFPGAYSPTDPGILYNLYSPWPQTTYVMPGPSVWAG
ncbi:hypothetical protein MMC10_003747 [Thelotrema lepadinum]|nr:hypothetical protein [Thelotrema lepadinum]